MVSKLLTILFRKAFKVAICSKSLYGAHRLILALSVGFALCLTILFFKSMQLHPGQNFSFNGTNLIVQNRLMENMLQEKGMGCNMPDLDAFSKEAMQFYKYEDKVQCTGNDWVECNKSKCYVDKDLLTSMKDIVCIYRDIIYVNDQIHFLDNPVKVFGDGIYTLNRSDHVKVSCSGRDLYGIHLLSSRWYGYKAGFRPVPTQPVPSYRENLYNVMILGFDSASRNGFIRKMPSTYNFLADKAIILRSYNVVGDGTPAALYAMLTGMAEEEHPDARKKAGLERHVDERLFIFQLLKEYGYRTAYFEDMPWIGTFQYRFNGFRHQPADHYLRAFLMEAKNKKNPNPFMPSSTKYCVGAVPQYQLLMNLADEFLKLDGKKFCFTFIADISHDDFNKISTADEDLVSFLQTLAARKAFEDTLILIMGDHGSRFAPIRETYQGKVEERLPLMAIILPEKLKRLRPNVEAALKHNRDVLTTPFDIHTTLLDVLGLQEQSNKYTIPGSDLPRAMSLLKPIPTSRSCAEAGIMPHWCACTKWFNLSPTDPMYQTVAEVLADYINGITEKLRDKCAERKLESIKWVAMKNVNKQLLKYGYINEADAFFGNPKNVAPRAIKEYYQAKIVMNPRRAVFEGTMMYMPQPDSFAITYQDISRVNAYGDEPSCISATHPHLNKYCFCKNVKASNSNLTTRSL